MIKRVFTVACMLLLVALGPALVASAGPYSAPAPEATSTWWSAVSNWWAAVVEAVVASSSDAAEEDDAEPPADPLHSQPLPPGGGTESNPSIDPNG